MQPLPPPLPEPSRRLALPGFSIGHGTDAAGMTGVTVILCPEQGALAAAEVRGSATGTRQFDSLVLGHHVASRAYAVVFAGGSGFGLSAADPVVERLEAAGRGFRTPLGVVPLVPTAILYDLGFGDAKARPGRGLVAAALAEAEGALAPAAGGPAEGSAGVAGAEGVAPGLEVAVGSVGAGTGATVGKARGPECAMKGGFGFASLAVPEGPTVAAAVAVNAFGDVRDPFAGGGLIAACREAPDSRRLVGADRVLVALPAEGGHPWEGNTTLAVVLTDATLAKPSALKVCQMAFGGLYRTLSPALSMFDGDLVVTLSSGELRADVNQVGVLAELAIAHAVVAAVREADGFGLLPAVRDLG